MNELALQKLIVDAVNEAGGYAVKRNNRFMVGIVDLLVKLPLYKGAYIQEFQRRGREGPPAGILEVKQRPMLKVNRQFFLDVTRPQALDLHRATLAGMPAGVVSFLHEGTGSGLKLYLHVQVWRADWGPDRAVSTNVNYHIPLGPKATRHNDILSALYNWQREWREGR